MSAERRRRTRFMPDLSVALGVGWLALILSQPPVCGAQDIVVVPQQPKAAAPSEMEIYLRARSVVDLTREELLQTYAEELKDLEFDEDPQELESLLKRVGDNVAVFFRDFPNTVSKEQVRRERLRIDGRVEDSVTQNYYYSVYMGSGSWEEGRTDSSGRDIPHQRLPGRSFLTSGFTSATLIFHPKHQFGGRFRYLGRQRSEPHAQVIAFAQKPGVSDLNCTLISDLSPYPARLLYQGLAWVDADSAQIVRLSEGLLASRSDVFLSAANADIRFGEVRFQSVDASFWLPQEVLVTMLFYGERFRNRHRYSDYQVATVAVEQKIAPPVVKK